MLGKTSATFIPLSVSAYFLVKRAGKVVNTVNHSLVLPELFSPKASAPKDFIYLQLHGESNLVSSF